MTFVSSVPILLGFVSGSVYDLVDTTGLRRVTLEEVGFPGSQTSRS